MPGRHLTFPLIQPMQNPRHFPSFPARQHSYTLIDPSAACVLLLPLPRSFFHAFFIHRTDDRKFGGIKVYVPTHRTKSSLLSAPSGFVVRYSIFFLDSFLYKYGGERLKKRTRCHPPW